MRSREGLLRIAQRLKRGAQGNTVQRKFDEQPRRRLAQCVAICASLHAGLTGAQSPDPIEVIVAAPDAVSLEREAAFASPQASSVIGSEELVEKAPQSLADALRTAPSVSVQQTTPGQGTIYLRGLSGRAVIHTVDGVRLNMAFFRAGNNDYLGLVDPYAAETVTIVPGAASVTYGSDALGGAVDVSTGAPRYRGGPPVTRYYGFQSVTSNPLGTATRLAIDHEALDWGLHLGFTHYQAGAIKPGEGVQSPKPDSYLRLERTADQPYRPELSSRQLGTEFSAYGTDISARKRLASGTDALVRGQFFMRPELVRYDQITPRFKREFPQRAGAGLRPLSRIAASALLTHRQRGGVYDQADAQVAWQQIAERRYQRNLDEVCVLEDGASSEDECAGLSRLEADSQRNEEYNASNAVSLRLQARKTDPQGAYSASWGLDARHDRVSSEAESVNLGSFSHQEEASRYPDGSALSEAGIFGMSQWRLLDDVSLLTALRGSAFLIDVPARPGAEAAPATDEALFDFAGSLGLRWEFAQGVAWSANVARGVRAPNVEDLAGLGQRAGGRYQIPNPDLGPEHSLTLDTGVKVALRGNTLQTFLFLARHYDAISLAPTAVNGSTVTATGEDYYHSVNAAAVDLYGIEAGINWGVVANVRLKARALVMQGVQRNRGDSGLPAETPADRVPPAQGELGLSFSVTDSLDLEAMVLGRGPQRRLNDPVNLEDNRIPEGGTPGYLTYHARGTFTQGSFVAALGVDNFTDALVLEHGSGFYRSGFSVTASLAVRIADQAPP